MASVQNFYIIHKSGRIFYSKDFKGEELDQSLVVGFSSSLSNFSRTLLGQSIYEVASEKIRIFYKEFGEFVFVAHCDFVGGGASGMQAILADLGGLCEFLFGSRDHWDSDFFTLEGADDLVSMFFSKITSDPSIFVSGIRQIYLPIDVRDRIDKLLSHLESVSGVCGNGTMLILADSCLYSRFTLNETRMLLHYYRSRPLVGGCMVKYSPVFASGVWQNLYMIRLQNYVLVVLANITTSYIQLERQINSFRQSFVQSRLEIPTESPAILLRLFAKRETLAMLYYNIKTGNTIFPQLRPGPDVQQKEILGNFLAFFGNASDCLKQPGVCEYSVSKDMYRFYARSEGVQRLFLLLTSDSTMAPDQVANDVLKNLRDFEK